MNLCWSQTSLFKILDLPLAYIYLEYQCTLTYSPAHDFKIVYVYNLTLKYQYSLWGSIFILYKFVSVLYDLVFALLIGNNLVKPYYHLVITICDRIWDYPRSTHNYKYLEIPILIIWSIITREGKLILKWNLPQFYSYL